MQQPSAICKKNTVNEHATGEPVYAYPRGHHQVIALHPQNDGSCRMCLRPQNGAERECPEGKM